MLPPGVTLNNATITLPNKSNSIDSNDDNKDKASEAKIMKDQLLQKSEDSLMISESSTSETKDSKALSSSRKSVDANNNETEDTRKIEDEEMTPSINKIKEAEEFKKFYTLLNTYQQNPNFMAAIAAAAASAANAALVASNQTSTDPAHIRSQQNVQMDLIQQSLQNHNQFKANITSESLNLKNKMNTFTPNLKKCQLDESFDPNKKQKSKKDSLNSIADAVTKQGDYQNKIKSRHHVKRQLNQKLLINKPSHNNVNIVSPQIMPSSSLSSFSSNVSNSSSSISSDSNSSSAASSPPPSSVKLVSNINKSDLDTNENLKKFDNNHNIELLRHAKSVPKIAVKNNTTSNKGDDSSLRVNFSFVNKSSENINPNKVSSKFIPPSLAALNSNSPFNNNNNAQNRASSEVKLKLKNAILQKLDRNKLAKSNSNINSNKDKVTSVNVTRSQSYLHETQNHFKQKFQSDMSFKNSNLNNINENKMINQHYLQQYWLQNTAAGKPEQPSPIQIQEIKSSFNKDNINKQIQLLNEENNLRRTTSEPNLKVKSALKDRLLERRNLLNPLLAKRPSKIQSNQQNTTKPLSPQTHPKISQMMPQQKNYYMPSVSMVDINNQSKLLSPSMSLSSLHHASEYHQIKARQNEQLLAALSQVAAVNNVGQNTELMNLQNQKQHLAASALLSLSNSKAEVLAEDQNNYNIATALRQLQQQQNNINMSNMQKGNMNILDSLAVASAIVNQNQQLQQSVKNQQYIQTLQTLQKNQNFENEKFNQSISFPTLPSHLINNMINLNKQNSNLTKSNEGINKPKFGHAVHVEEENEMLLENELKIAAKLNENSPNEEPEIIEATDETSSARLWNQHRGSSVSMSTSDMRQSNEGFYKKHAEKQHNQFYLHKLKSRSEHNSIDKVKQMLLLQQQQEIEEHAQRQKNFQKNHLSYFSDPYLLRSLETTSINSQPNIHREIYQKRPGSQIQDAPSKASNQITLMDYTLTQPDERVYRYTTGIVYDTAMLKHECTCHNPSNHLETAERIKSIWARFKARDLADECELVSSKLASVSDLLLTHNEHYALIFGSDIEMRPKLPKEYLQTYMMNICIASCRGFALTYDQDNSWNEEHTPLACRVAIGSTYEMARLVTSGKLKNGFALVRPPGSHAEFNKPLGFCYFNTIAIVAKMLKKNLLMERILIVDWDVHHGNGTQQMTYNDPNILYMSLHRHDNGNFFPGTGSIDECGIDAGIGKNVNIAFNGKLNPPMGDAEYLAAFRAVVMPIAKKFKPQIVLVSCGFDGTENHPKELGGYKISPMCFGYMTKKLMSLAEGKVVLALEGGYDKQSLCDCSEICLNALINKQIPAFPSQTLDAMPNNVAIKDLENVIEIQKQHWPNLNESKKYITMSQNQFISVNTE